MSDLGFEDPDGPDDDNSDASDDSGWSTGDDESPICPSCGVSALPPEPHAGTNSICENPDCDSFGEPI